MPKIKRLLNKLGRRNSAESIMNTYQMVGNATDSINTLGDKESLYKHYQMSIKSPNAHSRRLTYKLRERKSDKSNNSRNQISPGYGSTGIFFISK